MAERPLTPDEAALWAKVMATVRPMVKARAATRVRCRRRPDRARGVSTEGGCETCRRQAAAHRAEKAPAPAQPGTTLDGSWDRQLSRGLVSPDDTIDLHGHNLASAYALLDSALDRSIRGGDRLILLVTGKPPRAESERPHARGAIRAAVGDWLAGSRHAASIAAVRGAHPRHGGTGALYIILRKPRAHRKF